MNGMSRSGMVIAALAVIATALSAAPAAMAATGQAGTGQVRTGQAVTTSRLLSEQALRRAVPRRAEAVVSATLGRARTDGPVFSQQPTLTIDDAANGLFGYSEAVDGTTLVVGAPGVGSGGSVYVFTETRGTWSQAELLTSTAPSGATLGYTVAIQGNKTVAIGSPGLGEDHEGGVYLFSASRP
jgi:hypothetical protein